MPVIFVGLAVAGIFINEIAAADHFYEQVGDFLGAEAAQLLVDALDRLSETSTEGSTLVSIIGFMALLSAASLMFFQLQQTLNSVWKVPPPKRCETRACLSSSVFWPS